MTLFERVPQCDFAHLPPSRLCVDGDDYFYHTAFDYFCADHPQLGPHASLAWSQLPNTATRPYYGLEDDDRARAHAERMRMLAAILASPYHETFVDNSDANAVFGVAWNLGAFYVYLPDKEALWIFGNERDVVDILMSRKDLAGPLTETVMRRSLHHLFLMGEVMFRYSACPPTVEPKVSADA